MRNRIRKGPDARRGIDCEPEAFEEAIEVIKAGLAKGKSPSHIIEANPGTRRRSG